MLKIRALQKIVKASAELLDTKFPGWHKHIDTSNLLMGSPAHCIVGQLSRNRCTGLMSCDESRGFYIAMGTKLEGDNGIDIRFDVLARLWTHQVNKRNK